MTQDTPPVIREASTVVLVRPQGSAAGLEVFMVRRHPRSSFMSSAFVFPGGAADPGETPEQTAVRELHEEAGVQVDPEALHYLAHWITPSVEKKRFSARFYVALLPEGQVPKFDNRETVEDLWVTPAQGLERSADLRLPPPQIRTLYDIRDASQNGWPALADLCRVRLGSAHAILPRASTREKAITLLLPWDPDYGEAGFGDQLDLPADHPLAKGPSRFVMMENGSWKHTQPVNSTDED